MINRYGLSTCWNVHRHDTGEDIIKEITSAGFWLIEIECRLNKKKVEDIILLHKKGDVKIVSIHNYCPIPEEAPKDRVGSGDTFWLSSLDEDERELGIKYSKKTIELAHELDGIPVVFHLGKVDVRKEAEKVNLPKMEKLTDQLRVLIREKKKNEADELREKMKELRGKVIQPHLDAMLRSLDTLNEYAYRLNVKLGIENRYYYHDIPTLDELELIFEKFAGGSVYYWHDTGHGETMEFLGFAQHKEFLDKFSDKMIGIHIHDITEIDDHKAPGKGNLDFALIASYLKEDTIRILEVHPPASARDLQEGVAILEKAGL